MPEEIISINEWNAFKPQLETCTYILYPLGPPIESVPVFWLLVARFPVVKS